MRVDANETKKKPAKALPSGSKDDPEGKKTRKKKSDTFYQDPKV